MIKLFFAGIFILFSLTDKPIFSDDLKRWTCSGKIICENSEKDKASCNPTDKYAFREEDAIQQNVVECEAAHNLGSKSCNEGGFCCDGSKVTCHPS